MIGKLTVRSLLAHKLRLGMTALAVVLGVAFVSGTLVFTGTLSKSFDHVFANIGTSNSVVVQPTDAVNGDDTEGATSNADLLPDSLVGTVGSVDGVTAAYGSVTGQAFLVKPNGKVLTSQGPPSLGVSWDRGTAKDYPLTKGRAPHGPHEVVIDQAALKRAGYHLGDRVKIVLHGPAHAARVVGTFDTGKIAGTTMIGWDTADAQRLVLGSPGKWSEIDVAGSGVDQRTLRDRVSQVLPPSAKAITQKQDQRNAASDVKSFLKYFNIILLVFAGIALFVGAFIIFNTFAMLVAQRTRELALLRAIGAERKQVTRSVIGEALGVGIFSSTVGLGAGIGLAVLLRALMNSGSTSMPDTALVIGPRAIIAAYAVGIVVTVAAAYFPARRGARIPPVAAMRDDIAIPARSLRVRVVSGLVLTAAGCAVMAAGLNADGSAAATLVGGGAVGVFLGVALLAPAISKPVVRVLGAPFPALFRIAGRLGRQNALRNPRRTAATASALMIGLALVSTMAILGATMKSSVASAIDSTLGADYVVSSQTFQPFSPSAAQAVRGKADVTRLTQVKTGQVKMAGQREAIATGSLTGMRQQVGLKLSSGDTRLGAHGALLDAKTAKANGWRVGSRVPVQFSDGHRVPLRITGLFADNQLIGKSLIVAPALYRQHFPKMRDTLMLIDVAHAGPDAKHAISTALASYPTLKVQDHSGLKKQASTQVDQLINMVNAMLVLSIIIAALGILNTLALSVIERTREIGLLRAVGLSRRQLRRMVRLEAVVVAVFGAVLGVAIGLVFGWALQQALKSQGLTELSIPGVRLAVYVVLSGVIGVLAALWPAWRASRMNVLGAISTQ